MRRKLSVQIHLEQALIIPRIPNMLRKQIPSFKDAQWFKQRDENIWNTKFFLHNNPNFNSPILNKKTHLL